MNASTMTPAELEVDGTTYQYLAEASGGVSLTTGDRWWGTWLKYRAAGDRRWRTVTLVDTHPFEQEKIAAALAAWLRHSEVTP